LRVLPRSQVEADDEPPAALLARAISSRSTSIRNSRDGGSWRDGGRLWKSEPNSDSPGNS
jgi:hypothetical protein